jgi:hypothetical protein
MIRKSTILSWTFLMVSVSGCATIISGSNQDVTLNSEPPGARILVNGVDVGTTPLTTSIERSKITTVTAKLDGYYDQQVPLQRGMNYWFWGNILIGGLLGSSTDYMSNAVLKYEPNSYLVTLNPVKTSWDQHRRFTHEKQLREFILLSNWNLRADLAQGNGEYVTALFSYLRLDPNENHEALDSLRDIANRDSDALSFARSVVTKFGERFASSE